MNAELSRKEVSFLSPEPCFILGVCEESDQIQLALLKQNLF